MTEVYLFVLFISLGWLFKNLLSSKQKKLLKSTAYIFLLAFVSVSFWLYGLPENAFILLSIGGLLQLIPSVIGVLLKKQSHRESFLLFGTYGGGSRGMLALSILSPALLPVFIIIDLGNFLALIIFYPSLLKFGLQKKSEKIHTKPDFHPLVISLFIIMAGLLLNHYASDFKPSLIHIFLKYVLIGVTSFQIGAYLSINLKCISWTLKSMLVVRFIALLLPLLFVFFLPPNIQNDAFLVILLFSILPVSSIAISLLPQNIDNSFQESLSCSVTASTVIFISIIMAISVF